MKNFKLLFSMLSIIYYCFVINGDSLNAQIVAMPGSTITGNDYVSAASAGSIVVFTKPGGTNKDVRLASYNVGASGVIDLTDFEDFSNCENAKITKLSPTRAVIAMKNFVSLDLHVYDFNATGNLTKKDSWANTGAGALTPISIDVLSLSNSVFVSAVISGTKVKVSSYTVNSAGTITVKAGNTYDMQGDVVSLARMSSNRFILAVRTNGNIMKLICFDVDEVTGYLSRKGDYQWNNPKIRISMSAFGGNKLACFMNNSINYLDITTLEVNTAGSFSHIQTMSHVKVPGTNTLYELKTIDAQYDSGPGKIHLCAISTSNKLNIIPFSFTNAGILTIAPTGQYTSTTTYTHTSASAATNLVITASRRTDGKYHMQGFKWGN